MSEPIVYCEKCLYHAGFLKNSMVLKDANHAGGPQGTCGGLWKVHKPAYAGVFLDLDEMSYLFRAAPPLHIPDVFGDHLTLAFGRHMAEIYPIGKKVELVGLDYFQDERGQCVAIDPSSIKEWLWKEQEPHITISCAKGVKPMYSNELMKNEKAWRVKSFIKLLGTIDYFPRITS